MERTRSKRPESYLCNMQNVDTAAQRSLSSLLPPRRILLSSSSCLSPLDWRAAHRHCCCCHFLCDCVRVTVQSRGWRVGRGARFGHRLFAGARRTAQTSRALTEPTERRGPHSHTHALAIIQSRGASRALVARATRQRRSANPHRRPSHSPIATPPPASLFRRAFLIVFPPRASTALHHCPASNTVTTTHNDCSTRFNLAPTFEF